MNILIISGSRNPNGQTAQAAKSFIEGIETAGARAEMVFLPPMDIQRCRQCGDDGWGICRTEGRCVIEDDLASLIERIKTADAVVFATPVYYSDLSESLRALLDRLRRTCIPASGRERIDGKPAIGICVAGGGGGGAPACTENLDKILRTCGFDVVDVVPVRRQNLDVKKTVLRSLGEWLAVK